ncbi:MAG: winged helix-turn-helix transcriptional regulator [Clostridia bacterium]|nr:winged helix-turn-helix transcriptional regulator [Clostridia bacterium]
MYIIGEPSYSATNWYRKILSPLKNQARKKRVQLVAAESADVVADEPCAFVLGGSASWIVETVSALLKKNCHPIILNELPAQSLFGRYSCVKTDYHRFMTILSSYFAERGMRRTAFYGMNHASFADIARKNAFMSCFGAGAVFENNGSLANCFTDFYRVHREHPFDSVICANDFAAVSLLTHLREAEVDHRNICITVHSNTQILTCFPEILSVSVDHVALAVAAFEIADCITANPSFIGVSVTVDYLADEGSVPMLRAHDGRAETSGFSRIDSFYGDEELAELMRIEQLLSECDETDFKILQLLSENNADIGESTYLSDNGVKYRIKKMKRICCVASKSEIPTLLEKYGVKLPLFSENP